MNVKYCLFDNFNIKIAFKILLLFLERQITFFFQSAFLTTLNVL